MAISWVLAVLLSASACRRVSSLFERDDSPLPPAPSSSAAAAKTQPPSDAGAPNGHHVALDPKTRRAMKLGARPVPAAVIAFAKGRIGVLEKDALVVRDTQKFAQVVSLPLETPKALTGLADGSLFAVGATRSLRLLPQDEKAHAFLRVPVFPLSIFFGDRANPDRVWILPWEGVTMFGYDVVPSDTSTLPLAEWTDLDGFNHDALGSLRDGSFVYTAKDSFVQFYGKGAKHAVIGSTDGVSRILPASRPDTAWVLNSDGTVKLVRLLAGKLYGLETVKLEATLYDAEAAGERLAVLELVEPDDRPWSFLLEVFDLKAHRTLRAELPAKETYGEDWVSQLTKDRDLAITADPPLVAVGGPNELHVFDTKTGAEVFKNP